MKKGLCFVLAVIICLSLCACKKPVEEDNFEEDDFNEEYASMIERIEVLNYDTSRITGIIYGIWDRFTVSHFESCFVVLRILVEGTTLEVLDLADENKYQFLGTAACCLFPSEYWDDDIEYDYRHWLNIQNAAKALEADSVKAQEVLDAAIEFNNVYDSLTATDEALSTDLKAFQEKYAEKHEEEVETLRDWILESSMYVDHAVNPSGSLIEYGNRITEYEENLTRFSKAAKAY